LIVYCNTGSRAATTIDHFRRAGFKGHLLNGLGLSQWTNAGFDVVQTSSEYGGRRQYGSMHGAMGGSNPSDYLQQLSWKS
jgi:hypothetical protein